MDLVADDIRKTPGTALMRFQRGSSPKLKGRVVATLYSGEATVSLKTVSPFGQSSNSGEFAHFGTRFNRAAKLILTSSRNSNWQAQKPSFLSEPSHLFQWKRGSY